MKPVDNDRFKVTTSEHLIAGFSKAGPRDMLKFDSLFSWKSWVSYGFIMFLTCHVFLLC